MTSLTEVALFTDDVAAVSSFYRSLAGSAPVAEWPGGALFAVGDARILVHERGAAMDGGPPNEDHFAVSPLTSVEMTRRPRAHTMREVRRLTVWPLARRRAALTLPRQR